MRQQIQYLDTQDKTIVNFLRVMKDLHDLISINIRRCLIPAAPNDVTTSYF